MLTYKKMRRHTQKIVFTQRVARDRTNLCHKPVYIFQPLKGGLKSGSRVRVDSQDQNQFRRKPIIQVPIRLYSTSNKPRITLDSEPTTTNNECSVGLSKFMSKVYSRMGLGISATMATSLGLMPFIGDHNPFIYLGVGFVTAIGCSFGISSSEPTYKTKYEGTELIHYSENSVLREASFWGLTGGMGVMLAPFMGMIMEIDPAIVPASLLLSGTIFGGCALFASKTKNADIMKWKAPLMIGLGSLIGIQLAGLGSMLIFGPNTFSNIVQNVDIFGGTILFTFMSVYDAYVARQMYISGKPDALGCSTSVYLDFINLLIRIMQILAKAKKD